MKTVNNIEYLNCNPFDISTFYNECKPQELFSELTIEYLDCLSKQINKNPKIREFPDVATFSFFCRRGNILQLKQEYLRPSPTKIGRGIVFHIAPSNVPVNFAFSLVSGLLSGNTNIVRVSSKDFQQVNIISNAIKSLSKESKFSEISKRIVLVRYDRNSDATKEFSRYCDVRVIWGGDGTINHIRKMPLKPRSFDITFSDRYSLSVINADAYLKSPNQKNISKGFYNDTFLFDQNACTSPHLIIWLGTNENVTASKHIFWKALNEIVLKNYSIEPLTNINKLTNLFSQAIQMDQIKLDHKAEDAIWRINLNKLKNNIHNFKCGSGYFSEYHGESLLELGPIINRKYQTLSYFGIEKNELNRFINDSKPNGIDRIVPIGRTLDFSLYWDSYNLIESLSRNIEII